MVWNVFTAKSGNFLKFCTVFFISLLARLENLKLKRRISSGKLILALFLSLSLSVGWGSFPSVCSFIFYLFFSLFSRNVVIVELFLSEMT